MEHAFGTCKKRLNPNYTAAEAKGRAKEKERGEGRKAR
jgi:hypothetical protein